MATTSWLTDSSLGRAIKKEPKEFEFSQAIRLLQEAMNLEQSHLPSSKIKFKSSNYQDFRPTLIENISEEKGKAVITVNGFGLCGQQGPLPAAHSIWLMQEAHKGNRGPEEFLNLFNNRLVAWRYLIDAQTKPALFNQKPKDHWLYQCLSGINGLENSGVLPALPSEPEKLAAFSGLLNNDRFNQTTIQQLLSVWVPHAVTIEQFQGDWKPLAKEYQTHLSCKQNQNNVLNGHSSLGKRVWDNACGIKFTFGPIDYKDQFDFFKTGRPFKALVNILSFLTMGRYSLTISAVFKWQDIPLSKLNTIPKSKQPAIDHGEKMTQSQTIDKSSNAHVKSDDEQSHVGRMVLGFSSWLKTNHNFNKVQPPSLSFQCTPTLSKLPIQKQSSLMGERI